MKFKSHIIVKNRKEPLEIEYFLDKEYFDATIGFFVNLDSKTALLKILKSYYDNLIDDNLEYLKVYNLTPIIIVKGNNSVGFKKIASFNIEKERDLAFKISYPNSIIKDISPN